MKKTLFISIFALFVLAFSVSACYCSDTDIAKSKNSNVWGDNALLGGTTSGSFASEYGKDKLPKGCTGTWVEYKQSRSRFSTGFNKPQGYYKDITCSDYCDGTKLVEFYCKDYIKSKSYKDSTECIPETPEFGPIAAGVAAVGAIAGLAFIRRKQ